MEEITQSTGLDKARWYTIQFKLKKMFGKKPDLTGMLYIIGMQELGQSREFSKEEKMDLMHIALCKLLSYDGYYAFEQTDSEGWPHYRLVKKPPYSRVEEQEEFLKKYIIRYFDEQNF